VVRDDDLRAHAREFRLPDAPGDELRVDVQGHGTGAGTQRVDHVVHAGQRHVGTDDGPGQVDLDVAPVEPPVVDVDERDVGVTLVGIGDELEVCGDLHLVHVLQARVDDGHAALGRVPEDGLLLLDDARDAPQAVEVDGVDVGDDGDLGLRDTGEPVDLAEPARAHLDDRELVSRAELHQGERDADEVVVVLLGLQARALQRQDGRAELLDRGLARGARDAHDGGVVPAPDARGDIPEGLKGVLHGDDDCPVAGDVLHDHDPGSPLADGLVDERMPIEPLTAERHEDLALDFPARIRGDADGSSSHGR